MAKRKASKRTYKGRRRSVAKPKKKKSPLSKIQEAQFFHLLGGGSKDDAPDEG